MREAELPSVFAEFDVHYVQRVSDVELSSSCPVCGGVIHSENGEWPDRFRWRLDGNPRGFCRKCRAVLFPGGRQVPPEEIERCRQEQIAREEAIKRSAERALKHLREDGIWQAYHDGMDQKARALWRERGVPDSLQDWWRLGYDPNHRLWKDGADFYTSTMTIPIFSQGWRLENIKHRIVNPPEHFGKYRSEITGVPQGLFMADPDASLEGPVLAVEGEIKAMVVARMVGSAFGEVVGFPGLRPGTGIYDTFCKADKLTIIVDPDGREAAWDMCKRVGKEKCHVVIPEDKIDDMALSNGFSDDELRWYIRMKMVAAA